MLIDWFTLVAQAVNFLVLVLLLKRFLYRPIMQAMQERQERVAEDLDKAREMRDAADRLSRDLARQREALEREAGAMRKEARSEADNRREQWLAEAKAEVEARGQAWRETLERERVALSDRLSARMAEQVVHLAEKVLRDLAGEDLESRALDSFVSRLAGSGPDAHSEGRVIVRTGFPLASENLRRLETRLGALFPKSAAINASHDQALGFGIVLVAGDTKWEWNLASYLDDVEKAVFAELAQTKAGA